MLQALRMLRTTQTGEHTVRRARARLGLALPFLLLALMIPLVALGCAQPTTPAAQQTQTPS